MNSQGADSRSKKNFSYKDEEYKQLAAYLTEEGMPTTFYRDLNNILGRTNKADLSKTKDWIKNIKKDYRKNSLNCFQIKHLTESHFKLLVPEGRIDNNHNQSDEESK